MDDWKFAIWDWGGTIADDLHLLHTHGVTPIFIHYGLRVPTVDEYREHIDPQFMRFYRRFGIPEAATPDDLNGIMHASMKAAGAEARLFDDADRVIRELMERGHTHTLVSTYGQQKIDAAIARHGMQDVFAAVRTGIKDKADAFAALMREFGFRPEQTAVIGDMADDAVAAHAVGATPFICPRGIHSRSRIEEADVPTLVMIETLEDLLSHLR